MDISNALSVLLYGLAVPIGMIGTAIMLRILRTPANPVRGCDQCGTKLTSAEGASCTFCVIRHHPTSPPASYLTPWDHTATWEQHTITATTTHIVELASSTGGRTRSLQAFERGQLLTAIWNAHVHCFHPAPPPSYTTPWNELPAWRQHVNIEIFETIARTIPEHP